MQQQQSERQETSMTNSWFMQPQQFVDASITTYVMKRLEHILSGKQSVSMKNIAHVVLLLSVDEIKKCIKYILQEMGYTIKTHYKGMFLVALGLLKKDHLLAFLRACNPFRLMMRLFKRKKEEMIEPFTMPNEWLKPRYVTHRQTLRETTMTLHPDLTFMISFVHWVRNHPDLVTYHISTDSTFELKSRGEMVIQEEWNNIRIHMPNHSMTLCIPEALQLTFTKQGESYFLTKWAKEGGTIVSNEKTLGDEIVYRTFSDFLPNGPIKTFLKNVTHEEREYYERMIAQSKTLPKLQVELFLTDTMKLFNPFYSSKIAHTFKFHKKDFEMVLIDALYGDTYIPERYISLIEICFFFYVLRHYLPTKTITQALSAYVKHGAFYLGNSVCLGTFASKKQSLAEAFHSNAFIHEKMIVAYGDGGPNFHEYFSEKSIAGAFHSACAEKATLSSKYIDKDESYKKLIEMTHLYHPDLFSFDKRLSLSGKYVNEKKNVPASNSSGGSNPLHITVISDEDCSLNELHHGFYSFVKQCSEVTKQLENFKVRIWNVAMQQKETIQLVDNPDYLAFMERKELIESVLSSASPTKDETNKEEGEKKSKDPLIQQFLLQEKIPPKQLEKKEYTSTIQSSQVNEKYKDFRTLYLRQRDMFNLQHSLEMFHEKNTFLEEMGLPNKLGILLYGEPGTGKSSAILSIASYLKKDIYYVNLPTIQTNQELQMVFDHVNKHCVGGGIIVFEDIDAMSHVVHKRTTQEEHSTVTGLLETKDKPLTLEYFLNVLQGSLTQDGTIFIVTTNHLEHLDPAFYRDGRFDVKIEMKKCDHYQLQTIYQHFMKRSIPEILLQRIPENQITPATFIYHVKHYIWTNIDSCSDEEILQPFLTS